MKVYCVTESLLLRLDLDQTYLLTLLKTNEHKHGTKGIDKQEIHVQSNAVTKVFIGQQTNGKLTNLPESKYI